MVLDLVAQLDAEQSRRIKTERLLRQLREAKSAWKSEQISADQLALFAAELKAQRVGTGACASGKQGESDDDPPARRPLVNPQKVSRWPSSSARTSEA